MFYVNFHYKHVKMCILELLERALISFLNIAKQMMKNLNNYSTVCLRSHTKNSAPVHNWHVRKSEGFSMSSSNFRVWKTFAKDIIFGIFLLGTRL
jgi:hypothetical protein